MRIRAQFIITMLLFGIILVVIAASAIITNRRTEKASEQEKIASSIAQGASELSYLSNDYLIYRERQQLKRWQSSFASFSAQVAGLHADRPDQQVLVSNIKANQQRLKEVFDSVASAVGGSSQNRSTTLGLAFLQVSWSRMAVQSQGVVSDASRLSQLLHQQRDQLTRARTMLMYVMVGLFGAFLLASYMLTYRRILKSIVTLQSGAAVIGSGNLDFAIEEKRNDEIGDLSRAFNQMTINLKAVTASKADLEREVTQRKRAEEDLRWQREWLRVTLSSIGDAVIASDTEGRITFLNPVAVTLTGWQLEETLGQPIQSVFRIINEKTHAPAEDLVARVLNEKRVVGLANDTALVTKDGREVPIEDNAAPIKDSAGTLIGVVLVFHDVTEKRRAQTALHEAHGRAVWLARFPDENPNPVLRASADGRILYCNPASAEIFGWGCKVGQQLSAPLLLLVGQAMPEGKEAQQDLELGGRDYFVSVTPFPEEGYANIYGRDITERKQMEEALLRSRDELEIRVQERTTELANAYKELKEQSRILESFFKYTVTPLVFLDRNFNFIRVNEAYAKACQREVSEFPGHNHFEFYPSEARKIFEQVVETIKPYQAIARPFTFPDHPEWGTTYWDWNLTPILDDAGEAESLVLSLEDVTKRKQAETQLKAASLYARGLIEASLDPLVTINRDGKIMDVNRATELVTGFPREQLIGSDFSNYFTEPEKAREGYRQVFETGFVRDYPLAIRHTAGRVTEVLYNATTYKNEAGEVQGIFAAARDITERKRAEEALRAASLYTRSLIEASLDPLVTINRDGKIMDVNRATELVTGFPREQLIGSDFSNYFTEPEKAREGYKQVFETGSVRDYPLSIRHTSGRITEVLYSATLYRNETGELQGAFAAARDITKRKRAEDALKESENRLRSLSSQLLTVQENERKRIAREIHDGIGQILTAIKFKVEDVTQQMIKGKAYVKEKSLEPIIPLIQESIEEVRRIQMDLRPSTLDDLGILATTDWFCREFEKIYSTIHIEKLINIHENEVPAHLRTAIFRVMQEALNNIAKHSKADLVHLSLQKTDGTIELAIQDNGMGFNLMEVLSVEGSKRGLGLTSMRERTELSGGSFVVESTRGRGTVIRALWPTG